MFNDELLVVLSVSSWLGSGQSSRWDSMGSLLLTHI